MARYTAIAEGVASGTALKTILQIATDANRQIAVYGLRVSYAGTSSTAAPVRTLLQRQTSAGSATGTALTSLYGPNKLDPGAPASTVTCQKGPAGTWTTEPTASDVLFAQEIHPQTGMGEYIPLGDEIVIAASGRLAVVVVAAATVNVTAQLYWREGQ